MTAQPRPAPPTPLAAPRCPHCDRERALRLGSERARALYLHDLTRQEATLRALRRELAGLTRRPTRRAQARDLALDALVVPVILWERLARRTRAVWASLTDPATKHDAWAWPIAAGVCAAIFLLVVLAGGR